MRQRKEDEQERKSILIVHLESLILCQALLEFARNYSFNPHGNLWSGCGYSFHFTVMENDVQGHIAGSCWRQDFNQDSLGS